MTSQSIEHISEVNGTAHRNEGHSDVRSTPLTQVSEEDFEDITPPEYRQVGTRASQVN